MNGLYCTSCKQPAAKLRYAGSGWFCHMCMDIASEPNCRLFEKGHENPLDPQGTTAHVRDIKARRINTKTKEFFYYKAPKAYFFGK